MYNVTHSHSKLVKITFVSLLTLTQITHEHKCDVNPCFQREVLRILPDHRITWIFLALFWALEESFK